MKLYTYRESLEGKDQIGVSFDEGTLYPLRAFGLSFADMNTLICTITPEQLDKLKHKPEGVSPIACADLV